MASRAALRSLGAILWVFFMVCFICLRGNKRTNEQLYNEIKLRPEKRRRARVSAMAPARVLARVSAEGRRREPRLVRANSKYEQILRGDGVCMREDGVRWLREEFGGFSVGWVGGWVGFRQAQTVSGHCQSGKPRALAERETPKP